MAKVIVAQQSIMRDENNAWKPRFDITPASRFGEIHYIFGAGSVALQPEAMEDAIEDRLEELNYDPSTDYLLATGDMVVSIAVALAMSMVGPVRLLRWDKREKSYSVVELANGN